MADLTKCDKAPNGDIVTPKGRMSYAFQSFKGQENDKGDLRYTLSMLFPPSADLSMLKKEMGAIALDKCKGNKDQAKAKVNERFLNAVEKGADADDFDGWTLLRMSSPRRPGFIYGNGNTVPDDKLDEDVYSGRWARVSLNPYWFDVGTNKGVTCGLQNVQILGHDDPIGGSKPQAADQFGKVDEDGDTGSDETSSDESIDEMFD